MLLNSNLSSPIWDNRSLVRICKYPTWPIEKINNQDSQTGDYAVEDTPVTPLRILYYISTDMEVIFVGYISLYEIKSTSEVLTDSNGHICLKTTGYIRYF